MKQILQKAYLQDRSIKHSKADIHKNKSPRGNKSPVPVTYDNLSEPLMKM